MLLRVTAQTTYIRARENTAARTRVYSRGLTEKVGACTRFRETRRVKVGCG